MPGADRRRGSGTGRNNTRTKQQDKAEETASQLPPTHGCGSLSVSSVDMMCHRSPHKLVCCSGGKVLFCLHCPLLLKGLVADLPESLLKAGGRRSR